jgi:hypothetical protein
VSVFFVSPQLSQKLTSSGFSKENKCARAVDSVDAKAAAGFDDGAGGGGARCGGKYSTGPDCVRDFGVLIGESECQNLVEVAGTDAFPCEII